MSFLTLLFDGSVATFSKDRGTILIRLRVEWESESKARKLAFKLPPRFLINVDNPKAFGVLRYLCRGRVRAYSLRQKLRENVRQFLISLVSIAGQHGATIARIGQVLCQRAYVIWIGLLLSR